MPIMLLSACTMREQHCSEKNNIVNDKFHSDWGTCNQKLTLQNLTSFFLQMLSMSNNLYVEVGAFFVDKALFSKEAYSNKKV